MPSPVGHALGGIAAGWLLEPEAGMDSPRRTRPRLETVGFAALGIAADLDLLVGAHRGPTHGLGAVLVVALAAWLAMRQRPRRGRWAAACAAAFGSHVFLDWLGSDTSSPFGVPAFWPFSDAYHQAPWPIFLAVSRRIQQPELFWVPNILAVARELLILLPVVVLVGWRTSRVRRLHGGAMAAMVAILVIGAPVERVPAQQGTRYVDVIDKYLSGSFEEAVTALRGLPESDLRNQFRDLKKEPRVIQAAAMLHVEAAQTEITNDPFAESHIARARLFMAELRRVQHPGEFERGWYLLASAILQGSQYVNQAEELLDEARRVFPRDAELLIATGAAFELRTFLSSGTGVARPGPGADRTIDPDAEVRRVLQSAAKYLSEAATIEPELDEAHLRLGRVFHRLGRVDRAAEELELVRHGAEDLSFKYLGALFEASLETTRRRPQRAVDLYREALEILPTQSAFVGLSHAYYELGRADAAAEALEKVFRIPATQPDPWFAYLGGDAWHASTRLKAMRARVTRGEGA